MDQSCLEDSAVHTLFERVLDAWERGDGAAFGNAFANEGDVILFDGSYLHGRDQIVLVMQRLFDTVLKGTRCLAQIRALRFLTPEIALLHTLGGVIFPGEKTTPPERLSVQTLVAAKVQGSWSIASFQNTRLTATHRQNDE